LRTPSASGIDPGAVSRRSLKPQPPRGPTKSASGSSTNYITPQGYRKLTEELRQLWTVERPRVTQEVADAAALGDRSENAEYIYGKKRLREIDRRLRFLSKRIDELQVVQPAPEQRGRVFFGAYVTVEDEQGEASRFQLVGPDEYDARQHRVSVDSPLGHALLGKAEGDEVRVQKPRGSTRLTIVDIEYD
jgi:transcription elongation factor GreB